MTSFVDPRLDRLRQFDERSRQFNVSAILGSAAPRSYTWSVGRVLDQGREGACVGFAFAHELYAIPRRIEADTALALRLYRRAQQLDPWPGENYEGTSILAGVKAVQELGYLSEYRWAFNTNDLAVAVSRTGPAVLGIAWHSSMYEPVMGEDRRARVSLNGDVVGGHAILCAGYNVARREFCLHNSWGAGWGANGRAWISHEALSELLKDDGEAVIPVKR